MNHHRTRLEPAVRSLLERRICDVERLDVLLLLQQTPERSWTPNEVASSLRLREATAAERLEQLARCDLLDVRIGSEMRYRYAPSSGELAGAVSRLTEAYRDRRADVVALLASGRARSLRDFADAFRLGPERGDG